MLYYMVTDPCIHMLCFSDGRVKKIQHNEIMFAPFAHIKGCLFTLYNLAFGHTTFIMSRFNLNDYLRLVERNKVPHALTHQHETDG